MRRLLDCAMPGALFRGQLRSLDGTNEELSVRKLDLCRTKWQGSPRGSGLKRL